MPNAIQWSPSMDETIISARDARVSWDDIARAFGVSRNSVVTRGRQLGFGRTPLPFGPPRPPRATRPKRQKPPSFTDRPPLPAGHPVSWDAITAGTALAGRRYPCVTLQQLLDGAL
ncbi:MAG: AsnC family protein [Acidisphaera sp.]|nr:AsnC family protein [Acidisphaera sp.]MBV9811637.1 AsnC family protein [Acetobacteraceae bacterium]